MKFRTLPDTDVSCSEIGFGLWTVSTGWWGEYTDGEAVALMQRAFDLGINFFDAADTYGNGKSEELLPMAFPNNRDQLVISTKVGYNFYDHGEGRRGQREIPQDFSPAFIRTAVENALRRLKTDRIDVLHLHNVKMDQVHDDALWKLMDDLVAEGKVLSYGPALGPAIGWLYEGANCVQKRNPYILQHIYNMLEPYPGRAIMDQGEEQGDRRTRYIIRVTHSSGMLEGHYTEDTVFGENDHRRHRPRTWLLNGIKKVDQLKEFLVTPERTLGQAALQWLLHDERIAVCLPNIYEEGHLKEFAEAPDCPPLTDEQMARIAELQEGNFGIDEAPCNFKGTMERPELAEA